MPTLAQELIEENKRSRSRHLDLGNCNLSSIPEEIAAHTWITSLSLGTHYQEWTGTTWLKRVTSNGGEPNTIRRLDNIESLRSLQGLYLAGNPVLDFSPIRNFYDLRWLVTNGAKAESVEPLRSLLNLEFLDISDTQPKDIQVLRQLTELQELVASNMSSSVDFDSLGGIESLRKLNLSNCTLSDISFVKKLRKLRHLNIASTNVRTLNALATINALEQLDLSNLSIRDWELILRLPLLQVLSVAASNLSDSGVLRNSRRLKNLDLSRTSISHIACLSGLTELRSLNLSNTAVSDLSSLSFLTNLEELDIAWTGISTISPISSLKKITRLNIDHCRVSDLSDVRHLLSLRDLSCQGVKATNLSPLKSLEYLTRLDIQNSEINSLSGLEKLEKLRLVNASNTKITDLAPLLELIKIGLEVQFQSRQLFRFLQPAHTLSGGQIVLTGSTGIYVSGCPLVTPPPEIAGQGNKAILNYFKEMDSGEIDFLCEAKLLILGEGGAGKTSLFRRLFRPGLPLPGEEETTRGIEIYRHEFRMNNGKVFRLNVWDFGGQEIYHATHQFFLTQRSLYLLLDDTRKDHKSVSDQGFMYWLDMIDILSDHSPVLIFQNEKGSRSKNIDFSGIKRKYENVKEKYAGNLEYANAAERLREGIEFFAQNLSHIGEQLPAKWIKIRAKIETRAAEAPYISLAEYFSIYEEFLPANREKALFLSKYLHDLGVFLHFQNDELLIRTVILQNDWATKAVFRMLDDERIKGRFGRFGLEDCERLWNGEHRDMHPELRALMQRFELCYLLPDTLPKTWLAPQLLPPTKPPILNNWGQSGDLIIRYRYEFMPKGMISRLTVRLHRFVNHPECAYTTGVLFERQNTQALVELLSTGRDIEIRARGAEKTALLSVISDDLDALNGSFQGLENKVEKLVPCICAECARDEVPAFFPQRDLLKRIERNRTTVECPNSYEPVNVRALLDGVRAEIPDAWSNKAMKPILKKIKVFLASSAELRKERDDFDLYFRQSNDRLVEQGKYLEINRWENFLDAMSSTRLQDEYNEAVRNCDIFVSLFHTKAGKFTAEEFDVAHAHFKDVGRPYIYTFFKIGNISLETANRTDLNSMWAFKEKLDHLGHFYTDFESTQDLLLKFTRQLEKLTDKFDLQTSASKHYK